MKKEIFLLHISTLNKIKHIGIERSNIKIILVWHYLHPIPEHTLSLPNLLYVCTYIAKD
jgi:hypothetical protein